MRTEELEEGEVGGGKVGRGGVGGERNRKGQGLEGVD